MSRRTPRFRAGRIPFVVVQTAFSVNAFSDDMAVLLADGVKRTVPSRWPDALVVDLGVIADAPAAMNQAGSASCARCSPRRPIGTWRTPGLSTTATTRPWSTCSATAREALIDGAPLACH